VVQLKKELAEYMKTNVYDKCQNMGQIVKVHLKLTLRKNLLLVQKNLGKSKRKSR